MLKMLLFGIWMCAITAGAAVTVPLWFDPPVRSDEEFIDGLDYIKTRAINVPIIDEGRIQGYVVARLVYTGDARTLNALTVPVTVFVIDEAFHTIYSEESIDFTHLEREDLPDLLERMRARINERLQSEIVQDILIDRFDYISAEQMAEFAAQ